MRALTVVAVLIAALVAGCGGPGPSSSRPEGGETVHLDSTAAERQLTDAIAAMNQLDTVTISIHNDQGSWDFPIPMLTEIHWSPATGDFHASSRADDSSGDAVLEYLHVDDRDFARFQMVAEPPTKWSDVTDTRGEDQSDLEDQWITGLADFEPIEGEQISASTTIRGSLPSDTAVALIGTDFAGSLPQEVYAGTTAVTIVIEDGLPASLSFSGDDVDLAKVDPSGNSTIEDMLDGLRAAAYRVEFAEGDPADSPTPPAPDEVRRVSAFP
jgi:hypothetical protein